MMSDFMKRLDLAEQMMEMIAEAIGKGPIGMATATTKTPEITGEVNIKREGDIIVLPPNMTYDEGILWLNRKKAEDETVVKIDEQIEGFAFDAANAFNLAVKDMFGMKAMDKWNNNSQNVPIDAQGNTINVYLGEMQIPGIDGTIIISVIGPHTVNINFRIRHKDRDKADRLMALARRYVRERSIYRGKAFRLQWRPATFFAPGGFAEPEFIPTGMRGQLQVNQETRNLVQATVWTPIQKAQACRDHNIPLKRAALLEGPYGTGKTLFSAETATIAEENGWTFIYLVDVRLLDRAYQAARQYAPAVLFAEDVDLLMNGSDDIPESVRNTLDGIDTKTSEVIVVLTTNFLEKMPKSILRPGRLDAVVPFRAPNAETVAALVRQYSGKLLAPDADLREAGTKLAGEIPAVIREVVERSKLYGLSKLTAGHELTISGDDISLAADGMQHHLSVLNGDRTEGPSAIEKFGDAFGKAIVIGAAAVKRGESVKETMSYFDGSDLAYLEGEVSRPTASPNGR